MSASTITIPTRSPVVRHVHAARRLCFGVTLDSTVVVVDVHDEHVLFEGSESELHDVLASYADDCAKLDQREQVATAAELDELDERGRELARDRYVRASLKRSGVRCSCGALVGTHAPDCAVERLIVEAGDTFDRLVADEREVQS
jgi:hypothetical protein